MGGNEPTGNSSNSTARGSSSGASIVVWNIRVRFNRNFYALPGAVETEAMKRAGNCAFLDSSKAQRSATMSTPILDTGRLSICISPKCPTLAKPRFREGFVT